MPFSDANLDIQNVLEEITQRYLYGDLSAVLATATGCCDMAAELSAMDKLEAFLQTAKTQRTKHVRRHPSLGPTTLPATPT